MVDYLNFIGDLYLYEKILDIQWNFEFDWISRFSNEQGFWIGKASLRQWRQLALEQLEEEEEETKHNDCKTNGENSTGAKGTVDVQSHSPGTRYQNLANCLGFNSITS